jgi:DNA-binding response OmpR family regulator
MKGKVLMVDDDPATLRLFTRALEDAGFEVLASSEAIGTTNRAKSFAPDVVLLDVMMPALAGNKIISVLKKNVPGQPVVILFSNKDEDELKKLAKESGADDYITKLSGTAAVVARVKDHISRRQKSWSQS